MIALSNIFRTKLPKEKAEATCDSYLLQRGNRKTTQQRLNEEPPCLTQFLRFVIPIKQREKLVSQSSIDVDVMRKECACKDFFLFFCQDQYPSWIQRKERKSTDRKHFIIIA